MADPISQDYKDGYKDGYERCELAKIHTLKTAKAIREQCDKDIKKLQKICKHPKVTNDVFESYGPGHFTGRVLKICAICEKVLETRGGYPDLGSNFGKVQDPKFGVNQKPQVPRPKDPPKGQKPKDECSNCRGTGQVPWDAIGSGYEGDLFGCKIPDHIECDKCKGTGKLDKRSK